MGSLKTRIGRILHPGAPALPTVGGPLDGVNEGFHGAYDDARGSAEVDAPVFVVVADALVVFHRGDRRELPITPRLFHVIKSVAHAPVALFAAMHPSRGRALEASARTRIEALRRDATASISSLAAENAPDERDAVADMRSVLEATFAFAERALDDSKTSVPDDDLDAFARESGPLVLRLTAHATRVQLAALDAAVEEALAPLGAVERRDLCVIVTGDHQARARSLGMQYFKKRFGEDEHDEDHVSYAEGVSDADEALALVGRRRLDMEVARAFFGDAKRLQRDVLGDAVHDLLAQRDLKPIV